MVSTSLSTLGLGPSQLASSAPTAASNSTYDPRTEHVQLPPHWHNWAAGDQADDRILQRFMWAYF